MNISRYFGRLQHVRNHRVDFYLEQLDKYCQRVKTGAPVNPEYLHERFNKIKRVK